MSGVQWTCPHCDQTQISTEQNRSQVSSYFSINAKIDNGAMVSVVRCLNPACGEMTADVWIGPWVLGSHVNRPDRAKPALFERRVVPEGAARPMPEYVPKAIRSDYREACLIRELSPKASATLSRRCLQGMIRDFGKVRGKTLFHEIEALEKAVQDGTAPRGVSADSIEALTAVRKVGNIGAHMESDIDVIVDVDPNEATILINLIEGLIADWYVESHKRQQRFASTIALGQAKDKARSEAKAARALSAPDAPLLMTGPKPPGPET